MESATHHVEQIIPLSAFGALASRRVVIAAERTNLFAVDKYFLVRLMESQLRRIHLDEGWYFSKYPDIRNAVESGVVPSAKHHYVNDGYFEHRLPYEILVDEIWYFEQYPDVKEAVGHQHFPNAQLHFETAGYREGRDPHADFVLLCDEPRSAAVMPMNRAKAT